MAWRFCEKKWYDLVNGGRLYFHKNEPRVTGLLIIGGERYEVDWVWTDLDDETLINAVRRGENLHPLIKQTQDIHTLALYQQHFAGRTVEFGEVFDAPSPSLKQKGDYLYYFNPDQSGWVGWIDPDGRYIEWFSFRNGRCVIEGFEFRDVE